MTDQVNATTEMEILILTGMSGSGKSKAADYLEDMGYFCIDNLPPPFLLDLIDTFSSGKGREGLSSLRLAFVIDVRSASFFSSLPDAFARIKATGLPFRLVFLDCEDQELLSRYKQTRRNHPLAGQHGLLEGIRRERESLASLRNVADIVIDTTHFSLSELRERMYQMVEEESEFVQHRLSILVQSFGFKYGMPADADLVTDVRFIPNPFYIAELRPQSGQDQAVRDYVMKQTECKTYLELQMELLKFTLPLYEREGKVRVNIAVGCTGGRHRSVALADELAKRLRQLDQYQVVVSHRDILLDHPFQGAENEEEEKTP